jgi:hypothetical protein
MREMVGTAQARLCHPTILIKEQVPGSKRPPLHPAICATTMKLRAIGLTLSNGRPRPTNSSSIGLICKIIMPIARHDVERQKRV